ncbi:MAG: ATP-binding cassette domain-containing protein [Alphaproteobacteria bacterium]|nr:ATP-binding cassette domain-containing protein [Alphaproteobacteria bacterium]
MSEVMLQLSGIDAFYGRIQALRGVSLDVAPGEIVSLIGANGAGKTTLLMTVCGEPRAATGQILFDGNDITQTPTHEIARAGIAHSPEGRRIFPRMTVQENLLMGSVANPGANQADAFERVFNLFPRLKERRSQRGGTLSGGEQQMLAIARALMSNPKLLLLDEPSLGLAPMIVSQIFQAIKRLNEQEGMTVFLVEQNAYHALRLAHRGFVMVNGVITLTGTGSELLGNAEVQEAYLEGAVKKVADA